MRKSVILFLVLFCFLMCVSFFLTWQALYDKDKTSSVQSHFSLNDFSIIEYESIDNNSQKKLEFAGQRMGVETKRFGPFKVAPAKVIIIKDAVLRIYENGLVMGTITGRRAEYDINPLMFKKSKSASLQDRLTRTIHFTEGAEYVSRDNGRLSCAEMRWDKERGRLWGSGHCLLRKGQNIEHFENIDINLGDTILHSPSKS